MQQQLRHALWHGDWDDAVAMIAEIRNEPPPVEPHLLAEYLSQLRQTLSIARSARADLASALGRIQVAASFQPPSNSCQPTDF